MTALPGEHSARVVRHGGGDDLAAARLPLGRMPPDHLGPADAPDRFALLRRLGEGSSSTDATRRDLLGRHREIWILQGIPHTLRRADRREPVWRSAWPGSGRLAKVSSVRVVVERIVAPGLVAELEDWVARIASAGRKCWPEVELADDVLAEHLAMRYRDAPEDRVVEAHAADYYLAVALAHQSPAALRVFERHLVPQMGLALRRLRLPGGAADEIQQSLRVELLVGDPVPRIREYGGRGELVSWLRVTATRKALKLLRKTNREQELDERVLSRSPDSKPDPALRHLRDTYGAELKRAVAESLARLEVRQRNLLRQHVIDGLTIDELALLYRVHRATCARWLADARADLARGARRCLAAALGVPAHEVESVLRLLDTDLEVSISRLLREPVT